MYTQNSTSRQFDLSMKYQDQVDKIQWCQTLFSLDGEYVVGGSGARQKHNLFIWDRETGNLVKMLIGHPENMDHFTVNCFLCCSPKFLTVKWHPTKPMIVSISSDGHVYMWVVTPKENWSAFAPGFEELEDNIEYEEREDEYDVVSLLNFCGISNSLQRDEAQEVAAVQENEDIDIFGLDGEEEKGTFVLAPRMDIVVQLMSTLFIKNTKSWSVHRETGLKEFARIFVQMNGRDSNPMFILAADLARTGRPEAVTKRAMMINAKTWNIIFGKFYRLSAGLPATFIRDMKQMSATVELAQTDSSKMKFIHL